MKKARTVFLALILIFSAASICACSKSEQSPRVSKAEGQTTAAAEASLPETTLIQETTEPDEADNALIEIIDSMTLEEKVGQMFYARFPDADAAQTASRLNLGGYILFGKDFSEKTADEVRADINACQSAAKIPLLIGVDEEGGTVVRVSGNPKLCENAFLSPKDNFALGGWNQVEASESEKADLLLSLGINVNMAPVCDVTSDSGSFMYSRSFSDDVTEVCAFVEKTVKIYSQKGLGSVLKHFPGYGDNTDTHCGMAYDNRGYSDFTDRDFLPFKAGISAGADCILVSHNIVSSMDGEYPASLSKNVHEIIRNELGFDGVIMTDDLVMQAITDYTGADSSVVLAAKCGNDLLCCTDVETQYSAVLKAAENGEIPEEQINRSVKRILKWKQKLGLL